MRPAKQPLLIVAALIAIPIPGQSLDGPRAYREFPNSLPGKKFEIRKHWDAKSGTFRLATGSDLIRTTEDLVRMERIERGLERRKYGPLVGELRTMLDGMDDTTPVDVAISVRYPAGIAYLDKTKHSAHVLREQSHAAAAIEPVADVEALLARMGLRAKGRTGKGSAVVSARKEDLKELMKAGEISSIRLYKPKSGSSGGFADWNTLAMSAYHHGLNPLPANAALGVNAGTLESGLAQGFVNCIGIPPAAQSRLSITTLGGLHIQHSMVTFRNLQNAAPGANLFHWNSDGYDGIGSMTWILNNGIQTVSQSRGSVYENPDELEELMIIDDFAYRWPYPVFVTPTHNTGYANMASWQCYNAINVGNVRHRNGNHWELIGDLSRGDDGCTQTRNPPRHYGGPCLSDYLYCSGDREMPHLVAPGASPTVDGGWSDACQYWIPGMTSCGTSWSAPTVNGMAATVIAADYRMVGWPEKVRAVLLATAQNVHGDHWSASIDGRDGAGVVHGAGAVALAKTHAAVYPNNTPVRDGVGAGSLSPSDFNAPNPPIVFKISIPNPKPAGKHLRVVLTWDSNPVLNENVNELSDLDLLVTSGSSSLSSASYESNVEIVDIPNSMFAAGSTVDARINKWANRIPTSGGAGLFYYAIAWTWVKDHAD